MLGMTREKRGKRSLGQSGACGGDRHIGFRHGSPGHDDIVPVDHDHRVGALVHAEKRVFGQPHVQRRQGDCLDGAVFVDDGHRGHDDRLVLDLRPDVVANDEALRRDGLTEVLAVGNVQVDPGRMASAGGRSVRPDDPETTLPGGIAREVAQQHVALVYECLAHHRHAGEHVEEGLRPGNQLPVLGRREAGVHGGFVLRDGNRPLGLETDLPEPGREERPDGEQDQHENRDAEASAPCHGRDGSLPKRRRALHPHTSPLPGAWAGRVIFPCRARNYTSGLLERAGAGRDVLRRHAIVRPRAPWSLERGYRNLA